MTLDLISRRVWSCASDYLFRTLSDGRCFVVHETTGNHFWLNSTAATFLLRVRDGRTFQTIVSELSHTYGVGAENIAEDLARLVEELERIGVLTEASNEHLLGA